jgi:hypothetical protein
LVLVLPEVELSPSLLASISPVMNTVFVDVAVNLVMFVADTERRIRANDRAYNSQFHYAVSETSLRPQVPHS